MRWYGRCIYFETNDIEMDLFTFWNIQKLKIIKYYLIQGIAYSNI